MYITTQVLHIAAQSMTTTHVMSKQQLYSKAKGNFISAPAALITSFALSECGKSIRGAAFNTVFTLHDQIESVSVAAACNMLSHDMMTADMTR